jgi:hypothetical protein
MEPAPKAADRAEPVAAPAEMPAVRETVRAEVPPVRETTPAPRPQPPAVDIGEALKQSGLELVETRSGAQATLPEEPEFVPVKRARRPPPASLGEPLVQVETRSEPEHPSA